MLAPTRTLARPGCGRLAISGVRIALSRRQAAGSRLKEFASKAMSLPAAAILRPDVASKTVTLIASPGPPTADPMSICTMRGVGVGVGVSVVVGLIVAV